MTSTRLIQISTLVLLALFAAANLGGIEKLWGINFLKFFDPILAVIAVLTCLLSFLPGINRPAAKRINDTGNRLIENKFRLRISFAASAVILIFIFIQFSSSSTLLGDGSLRVNQVQSPLWWLPSEPLDFFSHKVLYLVVFQPLGLDAESCYRLVSALSGVLFIVGAFRLSNYLNPKKWLLNLLFITSSGIVVLFFGYIESYSIAAALIPFVFWSGLKAVDGSGSKVNFLILFVIAGLFHPIVAVTFSSAILFTFLLRQSPARSGLKKISLGLAALTIISIAIVYALPMAELDNLEKYILGLFPSDEYPQGIFTSNHWLNILNWLLIAGLPALALLPTLMRRTNNDEFNFQPRLNFVIWCSVPSLTFLLIFTPQLGGPRDWDLFSLPVFVIMLSALTAFNLKKPEGLPSQILPAVLISIWIVIGFAGVNSSPVKSAYRHEEIIEVFRFKTMFAEYANLYFHAESHPELRHRCSYYAKKAGGERPGIRKEWIEMLNSMGRQALEKNDSATSKEYLNMAVETDTTNIYGHMLLLSYYNRFETQDKMMETARLIARRFPNDVQALAALGVVYSQIDSAQKAGEFNARAFSLDSTRLDIIINYGVSLYQQDKNERAIEILRKGFRINPDNFLVNSNLTRAFYQSGNLDSARYYFKRTRELGKSDFEVMVGSRLQTLLAQPVEKKESID